MDSLIRCHAPFTDATVRRRVVDAYIEGRVLALTNQRNADRARAGEPLGPIASITKLFHSEHFQRLQALAIDLEGPGGRAWLATDRWAAGTSFIFLWSRSRTIAGGTSEIQRNVIAERVLGLPREPDDRDVPWSQARHTVEL